MDLPPPPPGPGDLVRRGLRCQCPNCGHGLFRGAFKLHDRCPRCDLLLERGDGFFLGSMSLSYTVTGVCWLLPVAVLWGLGVLGKWPALILGLAGAVVLPVLFYRHSRSFWFMGYYLFFPHELPARQPPPDGRR